MQAPVVHFEIIGRNPEQLREYYSSLFGWRINTDNPVGYGIVDPSSGEGEASPGIAGGIGGSPDGYEGHVTFYVAVPDVEAALAKAEELGGSRMMGPEQPMEGVEIGLFTDPEGHVVGVVRDEGP